MYHCSGNSQPTTNMKIILAAYLVAVMAVASAEPPRPVYGPPGYAPSAGYQPSKGDDGPSEPANYEFAYEVQDQPSGNDFGHQESRQGDNAQGSYHVLLPDGRTQKVDYTADLDGYHAKVNYDGEARPDSYGPPRKSGGGVSSTGGYVY